MKINVLSENYNKALERKDLEVEIDHTSEPTPSRAQIQELVAKNNKTPPEHVEVLSIFTDEGRNISKTSVKIWDNKTVDVAAAKGEPVTEAPSDESKEETSEEATEEQPEEEKADENV